MAEDSAVRANRLRLLLNVRDALGLGELRESPRSSRRSRLSGAGVDSGRRVGDWLRYAPPWPSKPVELHVVSSSTGETATRLVHALEAQFPDDSFQRCVSPR